MIAAIVILVDFLFIWGSIRSIKEGLQIIESKTYSSRQYPLRTLKGTPAKIWGMFHLLFGSALLGSAIVSIILAVVGTYYLLPLSVLFGAIPFLFGALVLNEFYFWRIKTKK